MVIYLLLAVARKFQLVHQVTTQTLCPVAGLLLHTINHALPDELEPSTSAIHSTVDIWS